jgi:hypothetical protein
VSGPRRADTILQRWQVTAEELTEVIDENPSLRGMVLGYVAEHKLRDLLRANPNVSALEKKDDHDRRRKGDIDIVYRGAQFKVECKSLQTNLVEALGGGKFKGAVQCDASDRRRVTFPNGRGLETTCLLVGEFDVLAANLFAFEKRWRFTFALNRDLPRSSSRKYTKYQRSNLLGTLVPVTWPPEPPFVSDPFQLFERLIEETRR